MKVKTKLFGLIISSMVSFVGTAIFYFALLSPIDKIESEHQSFLRLVQAVVKLQAEMSQMDSSPLPAQKDSFDQALSQYKAGIKQVQAVVELPKLNDSLAEAVTAVGKLDQLSDMAFDSFATNYAAVKADADQVFTNGETVTVYRFYTRIYQFGEQSKYGLTLLHINTFFQSMEELQDILRACAKKINNTESEISQAIGSIKQRSVVLVSGAAISLIALVLIGSFLLARSISKNLGSITRQIARMSSGDLTGVFDAKSHDEIGMVGRNLNDLLLMLNRSLGKAKEAAQTNFKLKNELVETVSTATSSAVEIKASTDAVSQQLTTMDDMIQGTDRQVEVIAGSIETFSERIAKQNHHVEGSASAVTEMLASIDNVNRITDHNRQAAGLLEAEADSARAVFEDSFEKFANITESIVLIQEMAAIIAGVASQTNILAMNAAIEAAHAGEFGKGFAVVADEIGKLASASSESSKEIAQTIRQIIDVIQGAVATKDTMADAFGSITDKIRLVANSVAEIHQNIKEMQVGSQQILDSVQELRSTSADIMTEAATIDQNTKTVADTFSEVSRISHEITSNSREIVKGLSDINQSIIAVSERSHLLGRVGEELVETVQNFTTTTQEN